MIQSRLTILKNTRTGAIFIADDATEETQCEGENRNHIIVVGTLTIPAESPKVLMQELYEEIKHGDETHKKWLWDSILNFCERKCSY